MSDAVTRGDDGIPEEVLVFGGESKTFHRPAARDETRPACSTRDGNTFLKERAVIASHYSPCKVCFPFAGGGRR